MINSNHKIVERDQDFQKWETIKHEIRKDDPTNLKITKKRNEIIINQERDQIIKYLSNNNFMKRRKETKSWSSNLHFNQKKEEENQITMN